MVFLLSRRKRAASQAILPQRSPPVPPGSGSLTKQGQASARASSVATEQLLKDVDFLDKEDIGINVNNNCGSPT